MKNLFLALGLILAASRLLAVTPEPMTEVVSFSSKLTTVGAGGGSGTLTVYGEGTSSSGSAGANGPESGLGAVSLRPGKQYTATYAGIVNNVSSGSYWLNFTAPGGYDLYLNGVRADLWPGTIPGTTTFFSYSYSYTLELRPADSSPVAAGNFSGIDLGKSVNWEVGLGGLRNGRSAGRIFFRELDLTTSPATRDRLYYTAPTNVSQITVVKDGPSTQRLRQVSVPQAVVDLVDEAGGGYWIKFYTPAQATWNGLLYTFAGQNPWRTIRVEAPSATQLKITETEGAVARVSSLTLTSGTIASGIYVWTLQEGDASTWLRTTTHTSTIPTSGQRDDVVAVRTGGTAGTLVAQTKYHYLTQAWGEELNQLIVDPSGAALTTTYDYWATNTAWGNYRKLKSVVGPTGNWTSYLYYDDWNRRGRLAVETHPFVNSPATVQPAAIGTGDSVSYDYVADYSGRWSNESSRINKTTNIQTGKRLTTPTLNSGTHITRYATSSYSTAAASVLTTTEVTDPNSTDADYTSQLRSVKRPDQSQDSYAYCRGTYSGTTFTVSGGGTFFRTNVWHGSTSSSGATAFATYGGTAVTSVYLIANKSTMDVTIRNPAGLVVRQETHVYTGGTSFSLLSAQDFTFDGAGRMLTAVVAGNGATTTNTYTNGRLFSSVDPTGAESQFTYDELGRVKTSVKKGAPASGSYAIQYDITTTNTYDGADHITQTSVTDSSPSPLTLTGTAQFDLAGRPTQQVGNSGSANALTTSIAYSSGGKIVTATLPGTATKVAENNLDGSLKSVTGSAVVAEYMDYSVDAATGNRKSQHRIASTSSPTLSTTTNDWLGRNVTIVTPGWSGGTLTQTCFYNSFGQLYKVTQPGVAATLYTYDTLGGIVRQGLDLNANGTLDTNSTDRITERSWTLFLSGSNWWRRDTSFVYATATAKQVGKVETQLSGLPAGRLSYTTSYDIYNNLATAYTDINAGSRLVTATTDTPDSTTNAVQIAYNGRLMSAQDTAGVTTTCGYDSLGRPNQSTDPRTGASTTAYKAGTSFVDWVKDPAGKTQATYTYDSAGRVATVTDVFGKIANYKYNPRNQKTHEWGDTVYPIESVYDPDYGRQTHLKTFAASTATFTDPATTPWPTTNVAFTFWEYDEGTGLLKAKYDAANVDSSGAAIAGAKKVAYTYTAAGQPWTRTNQRGNITTYSYSPTTGELTNVAYTNDPANTPAVSYTYNRLGQVATVGDAASGVRTFNYNLASTLEMQSEDLPATFYANRRLTATYATSGVVGRPTGLQLGTAGTPNADQEVVYGYQADGRLGTISGGGDIFTYGYVPNSHLVQYVFANSGYKLNWRAYEATRDAINYFGNSINWSGNGQAAEFTLIRDDLGRIISTMKSGYVFTDPITHVSTPLPPNMFAEYTGGAIRTATGYNDRSEVTSDVTYLGWSADVVAGRNDAYTFDQLGNRVATTHNVFSNTVPVAATSQYTRSTNGLNQYSERDVPAYYDVAGVAPGSVVTVNKPGGTPETAARNGSYFFDAYNLPNSASAVFTGLTATDNSAPANSFAPVAFVAKTKEAFVYDFDGNLTRDGRWDYTYDAENRLISMQTLAALTPGVIGTANARRLDFKYDYLGRRVQKTVRDGFSLLLTDEKFIYNGWLLIATLDANNSNALRSSYYWGLDLSGTTQGAGGVGGLLMTKENTTTYLTVSDHLGNIHGMVTASLINVGGIDYPAGSVVAEYEYDASGKTVRETGPCAGLHPFRSATKYTDLETGLVYYGQRYYSPSLGRFINQDPIAESGGVNLYGFCGNNGVNRYDYLGMMIDQQFPLGHTDDPEMKEFLSRLYLSLVGYDNNCGGWNPSDQYGLATADSMMYGYNNPGANLYTNGDAGTWVDSKGNPVSAPLASALSTTSSYNDPNNTKSTFLSRKLAGKKGESGTVIMPPTIYQDSNGQWRSTDDNSLVNDGAGYSAPNSGPQFASVGDDLLMTFLAAKRAKELSKTFAGTFDRKAATLTYVNAAGKTVVIKNVVSGNGIYANDPKMQSKIEQGPLPSGTYLIGTAYQGGHSPDGGDNTWFRLYGPDGKGGYSYYSIPVFDPSSGQTVYRGGFNIHVGQASDGCVTLWSDIAHGTSGYPNSADWQTLKNDLMQSTPYERKTGDTYSGWLTVQ